MIIFSEEAKIAYLQEKIKETKSRERGGDIIFGFGIVMVVIYFLFDQLRPPSNILYLVIGIPFLAWGIIQGTYFYLKRSDLMEQMRQMAFVNPKCPNCGKELPQGNFEFCPFCGKSLKA